VWVVPAVFTRNTYPLERSFKPRLEHVQPVDFSFDAHPQDLRLPEVRKSAGII
jgi:hypothetical protein